MIVLLVVALILLFVLYQNERKEVKDLKDELSKSEENLKRVGKVDEYCESKETAAKNYEEQIEKLERQKADIQRALNKYREETEKEMETMALHTLVGMVKIDEYEMLKSDEVKNRLSMLRIKQDELIKSGDALTVSGIVSVTAKKSDLNNQKKQILRCFNAECKSIIEGTTVKNIDTTRAKIQRAYEAINKIFSVDGVQISTKYLETKYEELSMIYTYMIKEDEEREQRKAIREQMVEEEKVRREIEQEKKKLEKEEAQFTNEVNKLMSYMQKAKDDVERQLYIDKISELQEKLKTIESDKENVLQREKNTRAGFVYIISNIGAFGENIFKIGMTRRLEPMDRIAELSSASVPFPFDVHALIFSEDAPNLESILHQHFDQKRVNKINQRKEFFKVGLEEIKKVVLENHNATVKFIDIPDAVEYRETLKLEEKRAD